MVMTDLQISEALALAIGWKPEQIRCTPAFGIQVAREAPRSSWSAEPWWVKFDYRDWNVIGPIAERYNAFPYIDPCTDKWEGYAARLGIDKARLVWADTPQKAIALAVIGAKK